MTNNNMGINTDILNIDTKSNLNIDDLYKKIILKKRDSIIKSHRRRQSAKGRRGGKIHK